MSVPASNPAEIRSTADIAFPSIEVVRLTQKWQEGLKVFFQDFRESGDDIFFSPHATDDNTINQIANSNGMDLYYLLVEEEKVLGYGLLRGWDEGYQIPSLGIAIHSSARGAGLGKMFIEFLHVVAIRKGANKMRLRVLKNNDKAIRLYNSLGYLFEEDANLVEYLVGFKDIGR